MSKNLRVLQGPNNDTVILRPFGSATLRMLDRVLLQSGVKCVSARPLGQSYISRLDFEKVSSFLVDWNITIEPEVQRTLDTYKHRSSSAGNLGTTVTRLLEIDRVTLLHAFPEAAKLDTHQLQ